MVVRTRVTDTPLEVNYIIEYADRWTRWYIVDMSQPGVKPPRVVEERRLVRRWRDEELGPQAHVLETERRTH